MKLFAAVLIALGLSVFGLAQDALKAAPDAYKLQFENEWVRVLKVRYAARAKVPFHDHSRYPAAYVYLSDSGPIRFTHAHWDDPVLTRPAVKARSFRLSPTTQEVEQHEVENTGDLTSDFLRIEFRKLKQGQDLPHKRVPPGAVPKDKPLIKVEFESDLLRITRLTGLKSNPISVKAEAAPAMIIVLAPNGKFAAGDVIWLEKGRARDLQAAGDEPLELLRFDLLKASQPK